MIHTIHVDHVLREELSTPYCDLVTRPTGVAVRHRIREALAATRCLTAVLDFSAVGLMDFSCADEVVAKLLRDADRDESVYVVLGGLSEAQGEAVHHVLDHQALAILSLVERGLGGGKGTPVILGRVSPDARTVFACVAERGPVPADDVAATLRWSLPRTTEMLDALTLHRLVRKDAGFYSPPLTA